MDGTFGMQYRDLVSQAMTETQARAASGRDETQARAARGPSATVAGGWAALGLLLRPHRRPAGGSASGPLGAGQQGDYTLMG